MAWPLTCCRACMRHAPMIWPPNSRCASKSPWRPWCAAAAAFAFCLASAASAAASYDVVCQTRFCNSRCNLDSLRASLGTRGCNSRF
eukprot:351181-Chlamydomonas_euryale.AAC.2